MAIQQIRETLYLIDIDQALEGFRKFISAWLFRINGETLLVDPGPASTIPYLVEQLEQAGVKKIEHVLLTHIHLDHAGGTGQLLRHFPDAKVNCHPRGIPHMLAPQKLWEDSKKILGKVAEAYGEMVPVPESSITYSERIDAGAASIEVIETPGHAAHHVSYRVGDILFAGEVGGVYVPLEDGFYVRPATPPPFQHEIFRESIAKAAALDVSLVCLGHYGCRQDVQPVRTGPAAARFLGDHGGETLQGGQRTLRGRPYWPTSSQTTRTWQAGNRCRKTSRPANAISVQQHPGNPDVPGKRRR